MKKFSGKILFLDRPDINTDEIIPARYLSEISKDALKPHLMEDLKLKGFDPGKDLNNKQVIITRRNFGCGSSREQAPWVLEANGINLIVAESHARIFRQNMFNCGMLAVELPTKVIDHLFEIFSGEDTVIETDITGMKFYLKNKDYKETIPFTISEFDLALVKTGGWVNYADENY